jgi:GMP synthase (glutamine-hydrolysing)
MKDVIIIEAGRTFPALAKRRGDFSDWVFRGLGLPGERVTVVTAFEGAPLPDPASVTAAVVTGSHAMVTEDEPWSERLAGWLARAVDGGTAVLGICYGHQLLARALGGTVGFHPRGYEVGTVPVRLSAAGRCDALFARAPEVFLAQVFHAQSVLTLPAGARLLAGNAYEPHQAVAYGERAWGMQFHPEFDAAVMRAYIETEADRLHQQGRDPQALAAGVRETLCSAALLQAFARLCVADQSPAGRAGKSGSS